MKESTFKLLLKIMLWVFAVVVVLGVLAVIVTKKPILIALSVIGLGADAAIAYELFAPVLCAKYRKKK